MIKVRTGAFETNSSSTHCLILCSNKEYEALETEQAMIDTWNDKVVPFNETRKAKDEYRYYTLSEFFDTDLETFDYTERVDGKDIHVIGKYGYDG